MCGIGAIIGDGPELKSILEKSLSKIIHRGNKNYEIKVFKDCVLGANRLAIVDRSKGKQPLSNEDETVFAVQNGEIFNYKELKKTLTEKGHKFKTDCDTEVLVHLWEEFGPKLVRKIDSEMYAFVIYDAKKKEYFIARDPIGVKPLYYAYDKNKRMHIASEIKQLSQFNSIKEIREFSAGSFFYKGKFTKYFDIKTSNKIKNKEKAKKELKRLIEAAIKKRVQTDLPIGVFLSGGVDSALLMELASKFHNNVTAIILGAPGSLDLENAVRFCKERNYPYHVVHPDPDYEKEIKELIYYLESYEPLIIRQSFANDIISRAASKLGFKIVLVGEAVDELFAGYNEFSLLSDKNINKGCELLLKSLSNGHHMRVDKMAMRHTIETRSPFFDTELVNYALNIDGKLKIQKKEHRLTTKAILREVAREYLPDYIAFRFKAPFANGAGMDIGFNYRAEDGVLAKIAHKHTATKNLEALKTRHPEYKFSTREEAFYFKYYDKFGYDKFKEGRYRLVVKDNLMDLEDTSKGTRLLVAEFDKLAMYFPVYLASRLGMFRENGLDIDFIATGGDDKTYTSLIQNSAQIGMADPMFAMIDNPFSVKGEIIGSLINNPPVYAVTFRSDINIDKIEELERFKIGTYEKFSTTNTITKVLLPNANIVNIHHSEIENALEEGKIEVAIVSAELAYNLEKKSAEIIFSIKDLIPHFLFTGFTVAENLEDKYRKELPKFLQGVQDSINYIIKNKKTALRVFKEEFNLGQPKKTFNEYLNMWNRNLKIEQANWDKALYFWRTLYPQLLHDINPFFLRKKKEEITFDEITRSRYNRCKPYKEFRMIELIKQKINERKPIKLVGFWGASDKKETDENDHKAIENLETLSKSVKKLYPFGISFTFILADKHAEVNGYTKSNYSKYLSKIKKIIQSKGWDTIYLNSLWGKNGITIEKINKELEAMPKDWWKKITIRKTLEEQAKKHSKLEKTERGAQIYYIMRKMEAKTIEKDFPNSIYWTYSDSSLQEIFPEQPTIYLYPIKKGFSTPPWFIK